MQPGEPQSGAGCIPRHLQGALVVKGEITFILIAIHYCTTLHQDSKLISWDIGAKGEVMETNGSIGRTFSAAVKYLSI